MCVSWRKAGGGVFARDLCVSHIVYVEYGVFAEIPGNDLESVQCVEERGPRTLDRDWVRIGVWRMLIAIFLRLEAGMGTAHLIRAHPYQSHVQTEALNVPSWRGQVRCGHLTLAA